MSGSFRQAVPASPGDVTPLVWLAVAILLVSVPIIALLMVEGGLWPTLWVQRAAALELLLKEPSGLP